MSGLRVGSTAAVEQFAAALDGTASRTALPASVGRLVTVTERLASVVQPVMDPAASARIRQRLVAVAAVQGGADEQPAVAARAASWRARRLATLAVGALTGVTAVAGVAVGAAHSLPGDPFYGLKRAAEGLQLDLAGSPADKGTRELQFAATRLSELRSLGIRDPHAASLLHDLRSELSDAATELRTAARSTHSRAPIIEFETQARRQLSELLGLATHAPSSLIPQLQATTATLLTLTQNLHQVIPTLPVGPKLPGPAVLPSAPATSRGGLPQPSTHPAAPSSNPATGGQGTRPATSAHPTRSTTSRPNRSTGPAPSLSLPSIPLTSKLPTSNVPTPLRSLTSVVPSLVPSSLGQVLNSLPLLGKN